MLMRQRTGPFRPDETTGREQGPKPGRTSVSDEGRPGSGKRWPGIQVHRDHESTKTSSKLSYDPAKMVR